MSEHFESLYRLLLGVVERHAANAPADLPESARIAWMMQPVRDILISYHEELHRDS